MAAPLARGLAGDDGGNLLPAGGRPGRARRAGCAAVAVGPAGLEVDGRGADGDVDRGDGGRMGRAAVVPVQVPEGGAFDLAGAVPGAAGGQQGGQDGAADGAGQVGRAVRADALGGGELVFGGFHRGGEAGPVRVGARAGLDGVHHGHPQQLVEDEQGPGLLFQAGPVA